MVHGSRRRAGSEETEFLTHTCAIKSSQIPKADKESCLHQLLSTVWTPSLVSSGITAATQPRTPGFVTHISNNTQTLFPLWKKPHLGIFCHSGSEEANISGAINWRTPGMVKFCFSCLLDAPRSQQQYSSLLSADLLFAQCCAGADEAWTPGWRKWSHRETKFKRKRTWLSGRREDMVILTGTKHHHSSLMAPVDATRHPKERIGVTFHL